MSNSITVYCYDPETHEYLSEGIAFKDPKGDEYLLPAFSTVEPPTKGLQENQVCVYVDDEWVIKPDYRGLRYWLGDDEHVITQIDEEPPEGHTLAPVIALETLKALKHAEINAALENAAQALVGDYPQAERDTWRIQQAELERWQDDPSAVTPWVSLMANARGISRDDLMVAIADNVQAFYAASAVLVGVRQRLRDEVDAAATADDVQAIQWPADPFA